MTLFISLFGYQKLGDPAPKGEHGRKKCLWELQENPRVEDSLPSVTHENSRLFNRKFWAKKD